MTDLASTKDSATPPSVTVRKPQVLYWLGVAALAVMCAVVYFPALHGGAIWDDGYSLVDNHNLRDLQGLANTIIKPMSLPVYYPMTFVSFWIEHRIAGLNPSDLFVYHLTNLVLQILNAWLLWEILRRLKVPGAWLIAAIWAIHPVQVESVAWVSERKNTLSAFFCFVSLAIWLRFTNLDPAPPPPKEGEEEPIFALPRDRVRLYILSLIFFALALLSKSAVLTLPPILLLILWWKRGRIGKQDWIESIPYFALALAMGITTYYIETHRTGATGPEYQIPLGDRFSIAGRAIWFYPAKLFWPHPLSFVYHRWPVSSAIGWLGALGAVGLIGALWALRGRIGRGALVAALVFAVTLFPILGFFPFVFQRYSFVADHLQYLACIGLIALVVVGLRKLLAFNGAFAVVGAVILVGLGSISWRQSHLYQNAENIWRDIIAKDPDSWMALNNLGVALRQKGDPASLNQAEADLNRAIKLKPDLVESRTELALVYEARGDLAKTMALLKVAQQVSENNSIHTNADANVYYQLGVLYKRLGDSNRALHAFDEAVQIDKENVPAMQAIGGIYLERGRYDVALIWVDDALKHDPEFLPAHTDLGNIYLAQGDAVSALNEWSYVLAHDKNDVAAMDGVGRLMAETGNLDQAIFQFKHALSIDPSFEPAKKNLDLAERLKRQAATGPSTQSTTRSTTIQSVPSSAPTHR